MLHIPDQDAIAVEIFPPQQRDLLLPPCREERERDNFLHRDRGGAVLDDAPEVLHQSIELFKGWPPIALVTFSDQTQLLDDGDGVVEFLPGKGIIPRRPGNREDIRQVREVVATGLRLDLSRKLARKRDQRFARNLAAFGLAQIAALDGLEHLSLRSQDRVSGFRDVLL